MDTKRNFQTLIRQRTAQKERMTFLNKEMEDIYFDTAPETLCMTCKMIGIRNKKPTYKLKTNHQNNRTPSTVISSLVVIFNL